jgi:hypothetical protein
MTTMAKTINAPLLRVFGNNNERKDVQHCLHSIYAHGKAQDMLNHDILGVVQPTSLTEGVHPVILVDDDQNEHMAVIFRWKGKGRLGLEKGLLCLTGDMEALTHAATKFSEQANFV